MNHTQITGVHERLMKSVQQELEAFERREAKFRAEDRKERAEQMHLNEIEAHAMQMGSKQPH
ncbi:hypothetical protein V1291_004763 [Nitrobacteraceae bacterium AZCC 1564]